MSTLNSTVKFTYRNTGSFFGVHVTSTPLYLNYYQLTMASGDVIATATAHPLSLRASLAHSSYVCFFGADEKFLPVKEEPQGRQRGGDGQQGAALRRRVESQQHRRQDRGAREHDPQLHDQVTRLRAGEAGEAQVLQQCPVFSPHGSDQAQLTSLPQELLPVQLRAEWRWRLHGCA
ncbi:hypothetical protein BHE74_00021943 [Ensete ventricosum]|nr:hypothetical protein BHE74_00021943 [Ensete ventricosum]